ncbi:putative two-component system response regulator [Chitinivorax tropicus]|uniref:Putative two-component system response regulator n=1 Tax=Chitinivorax tropicus TaxID=714531 RepID=A0A840MPS6_9PROT|nr:HD domain-containing phosphohydrolase [Chitinivorax tropicus]MBB5017251.1 putative two-component system response regulator [Chitinivorax tropicus]
MQITSNIRPSGNLGTTPPDSAQMLKQLEKYSRDIHLLYTERNEARMALADSHSRLVLQLVLVAELGQDETAEHITRVGLFAAQVANTMGESDTFCQTLRLAAALHDIGKVGIPDHLLNKYTLDPDEHAVMAGHTIIGSYILGHSNVPLMQLAADIALTHHERFDGLGYPSRLQGTDIPLGGRIVALVDYFDELTRQDANRPPCSDIDAMDRIAGMRGSHFDPDVVDPFLRSMTDMLDIRDKVNRGQYGVDCLIQHPSTP